MAGGNRIYHALLPITEEFTADSLKVTVDTDTFDLTSNGDGTYAQGNLPGALNPVGIYRENDANYMALHSTSFSSGNHSIVIQEDTSSIETSECFAKAVNKVVEIHEPTASLSKATFAFVEYAHDELPDAPSVSLAGTLSFAPTLAEMLENIGTTEYYATYKSLRMPLTYITSSKAQFTVFEQVTVRSKSYIRHHIITYNSNGSARWDRYDIAIPTAYQTNSTL